LASNPAAKEFVADAYARSKYIGSTADAVALLDAAGASPDAGVMQLDAQGAGRFVEACRNLRFWSRQAG
jgi:catalase